MRRWQRMIAVAMMAAAPSLAAQPVDAQPASAPASFSERFALATSALPADENADVTADANAALSQGGKLPSRTLNARTSYRALIEQEARRERLAPEIAEAVMAVESGFNPAAIGGVGEIGLMQILPSTARMLGFSGTNAELAAPATNIRYGITYLAQAWRLAGGDLCTAVMKYRAGHGETRFSYRSVDYCLAVRSKLRARGFSVTGTVPVATFGEPGGGRGCRKPCLGSSGAGRINFGAINTQLGAVVAQVRGAR